MLQSLLQLRAQRIAFTMRVEIGVTSQSAADTTAVFERLHRAKGDEWIGLRPDLIRDLNAVFETLRVRRQKRLEQKLRDQEEEVRDNAIYERRAADRRTRRTRVEFERVNRRNWRQEGRVTRSNAECDEIFDRFLAA